MDLRTQKTLRSIHNAFIELRSKKPLSKITIKELTQKAMISKPTFYLHYKDIYDLSDTMENEIIDNIMLSYPLDVDNGSIPSANWLNNLFQAFTSQGQLLNILFSYDRKNVFVTKLNMAFKKHIFTIYPEYKENINLNLYIDYAVHGTFQAYIQNMYLPQDTLITTLAQFTERFMDSIYDMLSISSQS